MTCVLLNVLIMCTYIFDQRITVCVWTAILYSFIRIKDNSDLG